MGKIHDQLKKRRQELNLKQDDMQLRVGMVRQQYQRLESCGNPRLDTLELVAKGLKMELMLIPQEKLRLVRDLLDGGVFASSKPATEAEVLSDKPWAGLLEE